MIGRLTGKAIEELDGGLLVDVGDDREQGSDYVGGIEAAAHAHFDDPDVALASLKLQKRHRGHELKKRRMVVWA